MRVVFAVRDPSAWRTLAGLSLLERNVRGALRAGADAVSVCAGVAVPPRVRARLAGLPVSWDGPAEGGLDASRLHLFDAAGAPTTFGAGEEERALYASLRKDSDGFLARVLERPISLALTRLLARLPVTPNQVTVGVLALGAAAGWCFAHPGTPPKIAGALLFWASSVVDGCDGELARLKFLESRFGGWFDLWSDNLVHMAAFLGIGWGLGRDTGQAHWPALGAAAALGVLLTISLVSWRMARGGAASFTGVAAGGSRLARLADALSRRDFIFYLIFLSAAGLLPYFLWAAALGTYAYLGVLLSLPGPGGAHAPRA